jgi:SAM-dependent methyltransferase
MAELIHVDRLLIRRFIRAHQERVTGTLLDVGCGRKPYREEFRRIGRYIGLDRADADLSHDLTLFPYPLADGSADWILCTQVLDDLPDHDAFIRELHRILRPNGGVILTASFVWELHDLPTDYGRPSGEYLRMLLERNGFEVEELHPLGNSWTTLGQVININLDNLGGKRRFWFRMISPLLVLNSLCFQCIGTILGNRHSGRLPLGFGLLARKI